MSQKTKENSVDQTFLFRVKCKKIATMTTTKKWENRQKLLFDCILNIYVQYNYTISLLLFVFMSLWMQSETATPLKILLNQNELLFNAVPQTFKNFFLKSLWRQIHIIKMHLVMHQIYINLQNVVPNIIRVYILFIWNHFKCKACRKFPKKNHPVVHSATNIHLKFEKKHGNCAHDRSFLAVFILYFKWSPPQKWQKKVKYKQTFYWRYE